MPVQLFVSVTRFIVQYRITKLLESALFYKLPAIRFHILTPFLVGKLVVLPPFRGAILPFEKNAEDFRIFFKKFFEQDIAELEGEDRQMFLDELGIAESGLDRLIKCSDSLLGLISFLTYGKDECRAWTIKKGTKAPQAAGKIHTDIERGFIRAEVIAYDDMIKYGGVNAAKEKGQLRSEGKEYVVQDGDMIYFRFNV